MCENICKRLDRFLLSTDFLDCDLHFRQWVGRGGDSDHNPVFMQILNKDARPRSPFKFNANWLKNEEFVTLLKSSWIGFSDNLELSPAAHFASNLKKIKDVSISWPIKKKLQENKDLVEIETLLAESFHKMGFGFASEEDKSSLVDLESRKRKIFLEREQEARMKSRALWLLCGDDNTPFFHK